MCERSIDIQSFSRKPLLPLRREVLQRSHVVKTVSKLDEHDSNVAHHRKEHLPVALSLRDFVTSENVRDLCCAVNDAARSFPQTLP